MGAIKDYTNFDYITIYVKKNMIDAVRKNYEILGWQILEEKENDNYEDIIDVTFFRPHKIENKDDLQILQVYTEDRLNKLAKLERDKYAKSLISTLSIEIVAVFVLLYGINSLIKVWKFVSMLLSISAIVIGGAMVVLGFVLLPVIRKKEKANYIFQKDKLINELGQIYQNISTLGGDKNEK